MGYPVDSSPNKKAQLLHTKHVCQQKMTEKGCKIDFSHHRYTTIATL